MGVVIADTRWHHSVFSGSRERLIEYDEITELFNAMAKQHCLISSERFSVDGPRRPGLGRPQEHAAP